MWCVYGDLCTIIGYCVSYCITSWCIWSELEVWLYRDWLVVGWQLSITIPLTGWHHPFWLLPATVLPWELCLFTLSLTQAGYHIGPFGINSATCTLWAMWLCKSRTYHHLVQTACWCWVLCLCTTAARASTRCYTDLSMYMRTHTYLSSRDCILVHATA